MPAAASIVLADAQATPVNHTYIPLGPDPKDPTIFWFEDQSQASAAGYWRLSVQIKRPAPARIGETVANRVNRAIVGLHQPILEVVTSSTYSGITPAPQLSYINRSICEFVLPERGVLLDRKNLRKMMDGALTDSTIVSAIENLQSFY